MLKHDAAAPDELKACWHRFGQWIRDQRKTGNSIEYVMFVEEGQSEKPHLHVLFRTTGKLSKSMLQDGWKSACASSEVAVYLEPVRDADNAARYLPKFWLIRNKQRWKLCVPWMPGLEWKGKRLKETSRRFLSQPEDLLWEAVKHEWFPDGDDRMAYSLWQEGQSHPAMPSGDHQPFSYADFEAALVAIEQELDSDDDGHGSLKRVSANKAGKIFSAIDPATSVPAFSDLESCWVSSA